MCYKALKYWRTAMRAFLAACFVAALIAFGAAVILDYLAQEPVSMAFAEPSARP
jgi:hypothetical protein